MLINKRPISFGLNYIIAPSLIAAAIIGVLTLTANAWNSTLWTIPLGYGPTRNHLSLFDEALADPLFLQSPYPDLFLPALKEAVRNGADSEDSHKDVDDPRTLYWYGNEAQWRSKARSEYESLQISDAYSHIGYAIHLVQDIRVPAHYYVILHGLNYTYQLSPQAPGVSFTSPLSGDSFERYASWHHNSLTTGLSPDSNYRDSSRNCLSKFWYSDVEDSDPGDNLGAYGRHLDGSCPNDIWGIWTPPPSTLNGMDWFYAGGGALDETLQSIVTNQLHAARADTVTELFNWSKSLPPLVKEPLEISAPVINTETGNTISFKIIENRTVNIKISLLVDGVPIKDSFGNIWNERQEDLFSDSQLPYGRTFGINWKGEMANGELPDGEHTLKVLVWDTESVPNQAPTNETDPEGVASVGFLIDDTTPTVAVAGELGGAILAGDTTSYQKISIFVDDGTGTVSGPGKLEVYDGDPDGEGGLLLSDDENFNIPHTYAVDLKDMPEGPIFIRAYDQAGNYETIYFNLIKNDRTPPSVTIYTPMSMPYTSFSGISDLCPASVNIPSGSVSISAFPQSAPITKITIIDPNGVETNLDYPEDYGIKSYVINNLIDGRYEVTVLDRESNRTFAPFSLGAIELAANEEWGGSATTYDSGTDKLGAEFEFHMQDWHTLEKAELLQTADPFTSTGTVLQTDMLNVNTADIRYRLPDLFSTEGFSRYYAADPSSNSYTLKLSDIEGNKREHYFTLYGDNIFLFGMDNYITDLRGPFFANFNTPGYTFWPTGAILHTTPEWFSPIQFDGSYSQVSEPIIYAQQLGINKFSLLTADNPDMSDAVEETLGTRSVYYNQWNFFNHPPPQNCVGSGVDITGCQNGTEPPADCLGGVYCHADTITAPTTLKRYSTLKSTVQNTEYSGILNVNCYAEVDGNCVNGYRMKLAPSPFAVEALSVGYSEWGSKTSDGLSTLVPAGTDVTVKLADWLSLTFSEVTAPGYISASIMTLPPMPGSLPVRTFYMAKYMELSYTGNIRVSIKYDGAGISSEQLAFMEALKVNDITKRDFTSYTVNITSGVVSFETPDLGAFMLGVPVYASPHSYASADLIGGTPEYSLQSGESDVTLSKVAAGTSLERAYSEALADYDLIPAGNAYLLGPDGKKFQAAAAVKMLYDKAVVSAKNLRESTLAIYQISEDGAYISRLVNSVVNTDKGEITAAVPEFHSIFVIAGSTVPVPEALLPDIWAPVSELAFALSSWT